MSIPLDLAVLSVNDEAAFFGKKAVVAAADGDAAEDKATGGTNEDGSAAKGDAVAEAHDASAAAVASGLPLCPILPRLDENVTCVGFPRGGQQISVTRGVVSRVDVNSHGVLRIQIDAAINPVRFSITQCHIRGISLFIYSYFNTDNILT